MYLHYFFEYFYISVVDVVDFAGKVIHGKIEKM